MIFPDSLDASSIFTSLVIFFILLMFKDNVTKINTRVVASSTNLIFCKNYIFQFTRLYNSQSIVSKSNISSITFHIRLPCI